MRDFPQHLIRRDLRSFAGYSSARTSFAGPPAHIWLNANEAAEANQADPQGRSRRYPSPQPAELLEALARYLEVAPQYILMSRGSDEAIDVLVRGLCPPGGPQGVVICSPTFGMYAIAAALQAVPVHDVPQIEGGNTFAHDLDQIARTVQETGATIVFLATPDNPTGATIDLPKIAALARAVSRQALVVLDEAYAEFAESGTSATALIDEHPNVAVLRTMSKAHALAGARVGALVAHPELIAVLRRVQAPYPMPAPVVDLALSALAPQALQDTRRRVAETVRLRPRLREVLASHPSVHTVYEGEGNFVLARCATTEEKTGTHGTEAQGADTVLGDAARSGIAVRDMRHLLPHTVRVSVGTAAEIDALAAAISSAIPDDDFETIPAPHGGTP
ncbi:MAG: histidinol-phosphate transaminase [Ornithinimicrobium sp.]